MIILIADGDVTYSRMLWRLFQSDHHDDQVFFVTTRSSLDSLLIQGESVDVAIVDRDFAGEDMGLVVERDINSQYNCAVFAVAWPDGREHLDRFLLKGQYNKIVQAVEEVRRALETS